VTAPVDAEIDLGVGYAEVIASDRADVVAEVSPTNPGRAGDVSLAREASVSFTAGRLRVNVPKRMNLFGQNDSIDVRVELPTGSRLDVQSAYGAIRLRGELGSTRIAAKYGNVSADSVGDLTLSSPYGTVEIGSVAGRLDVTAGHGHVRIERVVGEARLRGSHGVIEIGTAVGDVEVQTSGPLTIDRALGNVTARSAHGAIRIREVRRGTIRADNGYAEVEIGVPAGVAAWLDAASTHGTVRNELTPDPTAAGSENTVELRLRANWADVIVRRASAAAREERASA
jgi:DUF4097 and DUF4098 domain-containing protein YvlB